MFAVLVLRFSDSTRAKLKSRAHLSSGRYQVSSRPIPNYRNALRKLPRSGPLDAGYTMRKRRRRNYAAHKEQETMAIDLMGSEQKWPKRGDRLLRPAMDTQTAVYFEEGEIARHAHIW